MIHILKVRLATHTPPTIGNKLRRRWVREGGKQDVGVRGYGRARETGRQEREGGADGGE
jgi:hypothetical protein